LGTETIKIEDNMNAKCAKCDNNVLVKGSVCENCKRQGMTFEVIQPQSKKAQSSSTTAFKEKKEELPEISVPGEDEAEISEVSESEEDEELDQDLSISNLLTSSFLEDKN
jgi:hypothetical protein